MFVRITKKEAQKRFFTDQPVFFCPCKMRPDFPWSPACLIPSKGYLEKAALYRNHPALWQGTLEKTAWSLAINDWTFYNATNETGYYPHYYKET